jgi:hypothetical protein
VVLVLAACSAPPPAVPLSLPTPSPLPSLERPTSMPPSVSRAGVTCHVRGALPDPVCTPGATNPDVTTSTLRTTICKAGWTATIRPPASWSARAKRASMTAYGLTGSPAAYEFDHLIPLSLGGAPRSLANLWPELGPTPNHKDAVEAAAKRAVCSGAMRLPTAQNAMAKDWVRLGVRLGVSGP